MTFQTVKAFIFGLDDLDFLSILDGASFYNRKVTVKRYYWNQLFTTIGEYVALNTKRDKITLGVALKRLIILRLSSVSKRSFVRFFTSRLHHKADKIINKFKNLAKLFANETKSTSEDKFKTYFNQLEAFLATSRVKKVFNDFERLFRKKNIDSGLAFPDIRIAGENNRVFKKIRKNNNSDIVHGYYAEEHNAIYIFNTSPTMTSTLIHELVHYYFNRFNLSQWHHTQFFFDTYAQLCRRCGIAVIPHTADHVLPDPNPQVEETQQQQTSEPDNNSDSNSNVNAEQPFEPEGNEYIPNDSSEDEFPNDFLGDNRTIPDFRPPRDYSYFDDAQ